MVILHAVKITQFGYGKGAQPTQIFVASMPAKWVLDRMAIDAWTKNNRDGYQRPPLEARLKPDKGSVVRYLLEENGSFPTSVLVNVRGNVSFSPGESINENISEGTLTLPDGSTLWVIDGQHRLEALKRAIARRPELEAYPVPLSILNYKDKFDEMLLFYIVNSRQKKIPTEVAYRHLQSMVEKTKIAGKYEWIKDTIVGAKQERQAYAALIVDFLNDDDTSPFNQKIKYLGDEWEPRFLIEDSVLIRYTSKILSEKLFETMPLEDFAPTLVDYWGSIEELYPSAFKEGGKDNFTILKHTGVASFTYLFPTIYGICAREAKIGKARMKELLAYLQQDIQSEELDLDFRKPLDEDWWSKAHGPSIARATSEQTFRTIVTQMARKINLAMKAK